MNSEAKVEKFRVRTGTIIGSEHIRTQVNNQDGYATGRMEYEGQSYLWGIICDGCSAGLHNEVGAILLSNYLCREIPYLISSGSTFQEMPDQLFIAGLGYLRSLASHTAMGGPQERINFVIHHLQCTVIGFIMNNELCVFFNAGDGVIIVNNKIERIDQGNRPLYMAYHLLHRSILKEFSISLPLKFMTRFSNVSDLNRFAVCSDGIVEDAVEHLWGHEHELGLQRRLRVLRLRKEIIFSDDCTVIAVEKNQDLERR